MGLKNKKGTVIWNERMKLDLLVIKKQTNRSIMKKYEMKKKNVNGFILSRKQNKYLVELGSNISSI